MCLPCILPQKHSLACTNWHNHNQTCTLMEQGSVRASHSHADSTSTFFSPPIAPLLCGFSTSPISPVSSSCLLSSLYSPPSTLHIPSPSPFPPNQEVRPTVFMGVPRVWEKVRDSIQHEFERLTGIKEKMVSLSRGVGRRRSVAKMKGVQDKPWGYWLADK